MKNVSNEYIRTMEKRRDFYAVAEITFQDGTKRILEKKDFTLSGNSVIQSGESTTFPIGMVVPKTIKICLMNDDDRWSEYDFFGAKIFLRTKFDLDSGKTEFINVGNFTVITPETYGTTVEITATDDSYRLDKEYDTNISFPATLQAAVLDSCRTCGVTLLSSAFKNNTYRIQKKPEELSHRQFIGLCAMIAGGNAYFDEYNRLSIKTYDFSEFDRAGLDGGYFDNLNKNRYQSGDSADGGSFNPWNVGDTFDGGNFQDLRNIHILHAFKSGIKVGTDDVVITGVKLSGEDKEEYLYGKEGYVLSFQNQLAFGQEENAARLIGQSIVGLQFRPFTGDHVAYPLAEFMDLALIVDRKGNVYKTVLTDIDFQYYGFTTLKCAADSPIRNSSKYYGNEVKALIESKKLIEEEKTEREKAVELLAKELAQSSGLYMTKEPQEDGSNIYYMHDKPTLTQSKIIWKLTAEAFGISTDGGKTYPYGLDATGMAILNRIYAIGIDCDYLTTGCFKIIRNGKIMVSMDKDTGEVILRPDTFELSNGDTITSIASTEANKKCKTFTTQPVPPYHVGDIWMQSDESDIMVCTRTRSAGSFFWVDWEKRNKYIDQTDADDAAKAAVEAQTQEDIFNKLTDNGNIKGLFMQNGQLYLSFTYAKGGQLTLGGNNNTYGIFKLLDTNGNILTLLDRTGGYIQSGNFKMSDYDIDSSGTVTGKILTGCKVDIQNGAFYTPQITMKDNFFGLNGYATFGNRKSGYSNGGYSFAQGVKVAASGVASHAEGYSCVASGKQAHAEGANTTASGVQSHTEGFGTAASGQQAHAEGYNTTASGAYSHAEGYNTTASSYGYHTCGRNNSSSYLFTVGNGLSNVNPKNAFYVTLDGNMAASGTKSRVVDTKNYGKILQYCYETSSPMFGDIGEGITDDFGICYIYLDDIFSETVSSDIEYQVFLQKEGKGDLWVDSKQPSFFTVIGSPNLKFAWEIKIKQKEYEYFRLENESVNNEIEDEIFYEVETETLVMDSISESDYESILESMELIEQKRQLQYIEDLEVSLSDYYSNQEQQAILEIIS